MTHLHQTTTPAHPRSDEAPPGANGQGFQRGQGSKHEGPDFQAHSASAQAIRSERHRRVLRALLRGPKTREQLDRIAGASNGPDVVFKLRRRFGLVIPCALGVVCDRDGHSVERGTYSLSEADRPTAAVLVANKGAA